MTNFIYNDLIFASSASKLTKECHGTFHKVSGGIVLNDRTGEPKALVCIRPRECWTVTAFRFENTIRFMNSTSLLTEKFLNIEGFGYSKGIEVSEQSVRQYRESIKGNTVTSSL